jgi:hypothetical protein
MLGRYPKTLHLDGSGLVDAIGRRERLRWQDLAGRHVVVEEKIDGSETSFHFDSDAVLHVRARINDLAVSQRGGAEKPFDTLKDWLVAIEEALFDRILDRYAVYGEWAYACHSVYYDALPHHFLEFDVYDKLTGEFLSTDRRRALLEGLPIHSVPVLYQGHAGRDHPSSLVAAPLFRSPGWKATAAASASRAGVEPAAFLARVADNGLAEGVYGKIEEDGTVVARFKWVRPDFVSGIVEGGRHWKDAPLVPNTVAESFIPHHNLMTKT